MAEGLGKREMGAPVQRGVGLRRLAHTALSTIMNDGHSGTIPITVTHPDGQTSIFYGWSSDIFLAIDPGTGATVSGRQVSVSILIADLFAAGFEAIRNIPDVASRPWVVSFLDVNDRPWTFKVANVNPDRTAGLMVIFLEAYKQ
jgi:hypothetical protein